MHLTFHHISVELPLKQWQWDTQGSSFTSKYSLNQPFTKSDFHQMGDNAANLHSTNARSHLHCQEAGRICHKNYLVMSIESSL